MHVIKNEFVPSEKSYCANRIHYDSSSFLVFHYFALKMPQVIFLPDRCLIDSHNCMIAYGNIKSRFKEQLLSTIKEKKGWLFT